jgi:hypothetical protein
MTVSTVVYVFIRGIDFASDYDFSIVFWSCSSLYILFSEQSKKDNSIITSYGHLSLQTTEHKQNHEIWVRFVVFNATFSTIFQLYRGGQFYW